MQYCLTWLYVQIPTYSTHTRTLGRIVLSRVTFSDLIAMHLKYIHCDTTLQIFLQGKLTFWNFKWFKLDRLNIIHQIRHLFCGHCLTPSSSLKAGIKTKKWNISRVSTTFSKVIFPGKWSQDSSQQKTVPLLKRITAVRNSLQEKESNPGEGP